VRDGGEREAVIPADELPVELSTGLDAQSETAEVHRRNARIGVMYGLGAYLWWGMVPLYFKALTHVPASEILAHRIVWSVLLLAILMRVRGRWAAALTALKDRRTLVTLLGTTVLIASNWYLFIYAIAEKRTLEAGLGYFINPLVNVLLGVVFLRERLRPWQIVSVTLAAVGVSYRTWAMGSVPVLALLLAFTFSFYGFLRKTVRMEALAGLTVETALLSPLAVAYVAYLMSQDRSFFIGHSPSTTILLVISGVITSVPLLWFTNAARRLRFSTVGFLQYLSPSLQCLLAVTVFGELFARTQWISFSFIWLALAVYSVDAWRAARGPSAAARV